MVIPASLEDFLEPLHHGVWEVAIPKESVPGTLGSGWIKSALNVPSPGTIASYRKGQYHAHETATEWRVHLDRYDPKLHPVLHIVDDAPLLLIVADTFVTLIMETRRGAGGNTREILREQRRVWQTQVIIGVALLLVGGSILTDPLQSFETTVTVAIPLLLVILGAVVAARGVSVTEARVTSKGSIFLGLGVVAIGTISFFLPIDVWATVVFAVLAVWGLGSAAVSLAHVAKGRPGVPEGLYHRLLLGVFSLLLAILPFVNMYAAAALLMIFLGGITLLLGITLAVNGLRLRTRMKNATGM